MGLFLGIEIGGTKLQLGLGRGDGQLLARKRLNVDVERGGAGIREQIVATVPVLLADAGLNGDELKGIGVGFGGPVDDATKRVITSHQIEGWDDFPLADWLTEQLAIPAVLGNDADVAGLAEALLGAGQGLSPIFYMTVGSGIGGGFIIDGEIYRGVGRGAAEIGHLRVVDRRSLADNKPHPLEAVASGWGIGNYARKLLGLGAGKDSALRKCGVAVSDITAKEIGEAAQAGDKFAGRLFLDCLEPIAEALCAVCVLLCPKRIVIGGGVSLVGEEHFFQPLRQLMADRAFAPFAGLTEIVPASLGEWVVVHGATVLARRRFAD